VPPVPPLLDELEAVVAADELTLDEPVEVVDDDALEDDALPDVVVVLELLEALEVGPPGAPPVPKEKLGYPHPAIIKAAAPPTIACGDIARAA
jgi:hypothetical protein